MSIADIQGDIREIKTNLGWHLKFMVLIGTGLLFLFYWIFAVLPGRQRQAVNGPVEALQVTVTQLQTALVLNSATPLPLSQQETTIQSVKEMLSTARNKNVSISPAVLDSVQAGLLRADTSVHGYWPVVFQFIAYRSMLITGRFVPGMPINAFMRNVHSRPSSVIKGGAYKLEGTIEGFVFVNAWIEFNGDSLPDLVNTQFDHCVLVFRGLDVDSPPQLSRSVATQILASSIYNVVITTKPS